MTCDSGVPEVSHIERQTNEVIGLRIYVDVDAQAWRAGVTCDVTPRPLLPRIPLDDAGADQLHKTICLHEHGSTGCDCFTD